MTVTGFKDPGWPPTDGPLQAEAREASDRNLFGIITQSRGCYQGLDCNNVDHPFGVLSPSFIFNSLNVLYPLRATSVGV